MRYSPPVPKLSLRNADGRLVYLATVYHLGRPGSETDALTLARHGLGLGPAREALEPQIERPTIEIELSEYQLSRLGEALLGVVNELKQYEIAGGRSAVPGFAETMRRLFPGRQDEPGAALDLARQAVMLRRRLDETVREADAAVGAAREEQDRRRASERRPWWRKWRIWWPGRSGAGP